MSQPAPTPDSPTHNGHADAGPVAIAGSGTIACGLAACAAASGLRVTLLARSADSAARAQATLARLSEKAGDIDASVSVQVSDDGFELAAARLVVEAVVEREDVKRRVLGEIGSALPADALIASTTSSLSISELAGSCGRPERFFGLHVFNPVDRMPLVELCFPDQASGDTRRRAEAFCAAIGKTPVEVPDEPGFVVNRLLFPYLFDAVRLLERTGLEPEAIDACMKLGASHPMGPLELLDLIGIDVAEAIGEALHDDTGDAAHLPPGRIKGMVREGRLGRKSGAGFYEYR